MTLENFSSYWSAIAALVTAIIGLLVAFNKPVKQATASVYRQMADKLDPRPNSEDGWDCATTDGGRFICVREAK